MKNKNGTLATRTITHYCSRNRGFKCTVFELGVGQTGGHQLRLMLQRLHICKSGAGDVVEVNGGPWK